MTDGVSVLQGVSNLRRPRSIYVKKRLQLEDLKEGDQFTVTRHIYGFKILFAALLTGDYNRLHWHPGFAKKRGNRSIVAHGVVLIGFISAAAARLFKDGCRVTDVQAKLRKPLCAGDEAHCTLTIKKTNRRGRVTLDVEVKNGPEGDLVCSGSCEVWLE